MSAFPVPEDGLPAEKSTLVRRRGGPSPKGKGEESAFPSLLGRGQTRSEGDGAEVGFSDTGAGGAAIPLLLLLLLTAFRLWYATRHELLQDEAYYWQWARHLDWGYYDNTPLMAPVIQLFVTLLGPTELGVRAGAVVCAFAVTVFIYRLARRLCGPTVAFAAAALANVVPLFAAGSVIMTQDPVQLALWAAALYRVQRALTEGGWGRWLFAGLLAGLAAQAKLNALLLLPGIFLYLILSPAMRARWLRRPEPYCAGLLAVLVFTPFLIWNHAHGNAFGMHIHAMGTRTGAHDPPLKWTLRFLGDQALVLSPLVFLTYLYALWDSGRRGLRGDDALLFLWCPSVVVFAATVWVSLHSKIEANWAVAAYISGLILVASVFVRAWQERGCVGRAWAGASVSLAALLSVCVLFPNLLYGAGLRLPRATSDRTNELYGWRTLAARVAQEQAAMSANGPRPFVFGINYRMPSECAFYLPDQPQTYSLFLHDRANEYLFWEDEHALMGRDAVFVNDTDTHDHFQDLRAVFTRIAPQPPLLIYRLPYGRVPIRTVQIVRCYGFKGYDRARWQDGW